jgi:hypothetical protein
VVQKLVSPSVDLMGGELITVVIKRMLVSSAHHVSIYCSGSETSITQCRSNGWGAHNCGHFNIINLDLLSFSNYQFSDKRFQLQSLAGSYI